MTDRVAVYVPDDVSLPDVLAAAIRAGAYVKSTDVSGVASFRVVVVDRGAADALRQKFAGLRFVPDITPAAPQPPAESAPVSHVGAESGPEVDIPTTPVSSLAADSTTRPDGETKPVKKAARKKTKTTKKTTTTKRKTRGDQGGS